MTGDHPPLRVGVPGCGDLAARCTGRFAGRPVTGYRRLLDCHDVDAAYLALPSGLELMLPADDQFHNAVGAFADAGWAGRSGLLDAIRQTAARFEPGEPESAPTWR